MARFLGEFENLRDCFCELGEPGVWTHRADQHRFEADTGAIAIWWPKTKTIIFQGRPNAAEALEKALKVTAGDIYRPSRPVAGC